MSMRIGVYAIAKNEEQFVQSWYESAREADVLLIADTGSADDTVAKARSLGITVVELALSPFRFDDARNASLAALPRDLDFVVALDLDEQLQPGWRTAIENAPTGATRLRYQYTWNWNEDGTPGLQYGGDKIHARHGYRWKHPVHEVAVKYDGPEVQAWVPLEIHHHADNSKPRSQYLPLLEMSVREDPHDDRNAFYLAREYFNYGMTDKARTEFVRYLNLPTAAWEAERAAAFRYLAKCDPENADLMLQRALNESPRREVLVDLAKHHHDRGEWEQCFEAATAALNIHSKPLDYLCEDFAWGPAAADYAAVAAYWLGKYGEAVQYGQQAIDAAPQDERLIRNLSFYKEKVHGDIHSN